MSAGAWAAFLVAAAIGAPLRYLVDLRVQERTEGAFPWGTFIVNTSGSFALGLLTGFGLYHGLAATTRTIVGTGGLGAYTTFSTLSYETVRLAEDGATTDAVWNAAGGAIAGLAAASLGLALASLL